MKVKIKGCTGETFAKRAFKLLYDACGGAVGMGVLQERQNVSEDDIWENVCTAGDYPGRKEFENRESGDVYGDYVFGRMIKWGCKFDKESVIIRDGEFRRDYQGFSHAYKDNEAIMAVVAKSLSINYVIEAEAESRQ